MTMRFDGDRGGRLPARAREKVPDAIETVLAKWGDGMSHREIASALGLSKGTIVGLIQRSSGPIADKARSDHRLNVGARQSARKTGIRKHPDLDQRVATQWISGKSASEIATDLGVTRNTVIGIISRGKFERPQAAALAVRSEAQAKGCATKLAKSERQRDETAQAMVKRRAAGKLLRQSPQLELVSSIELPQQPPEPTPDLYAHLRNDGALRKALADMVVPRDIGAGIT
jgi:hypothetical protein